MAIYVPVIPVNEGGGPGSGGISGGAEGAGVAGKNLREGGNISLRPNVLTSRHLYNIRNQTWAIPRQTFDGANSQIETYSQYNADAGVLPSNTYSVAPFTKIGSASFG